MFLMCLVYEFVIFILSSGFDNKGGIFAARISRDGKPDAESLKRGIFKIENIRTGRKVIPFFLLLTLEKWQLFIKIIN